MAGFFGKIFAFSRLATYLPDMLHFFSLSIPMMRSGDMSLCSFPRCVVYSRRLVNFFLHTGHSFSKVGICTTKWKISILRYSKFTACQTRPRPNRRARHAPECQGPSPPLQEAP